MDDSAIPTKFLEKLYELTGNGKTNKGFLLFYVDGNGEVRHSYSQKWTGVVKAALRKRAHDLLEVLDNEEMAEHFGGHEHD